MINSRNLIYTNILDLTVFHPDLATRPAVGEHVISEWELTS
ncbi:hypothetical protein HCY95_01657 [Limosilactobacillus fermentum]|uniref:Uncharacterized protein n=1 Tax=Limosilactobacillus fermentum TaxID=1613 RepID=A0AAJ4GF58_LIMFE|nr:hypothetical protein HCY95_01657 [Limosilactobacillus fermentum]